MIQGKDSYGYSWEVKKSMAGGDKVVVEVFGDALMLYPHQADNLAKALRQISREVKEIGERKAIQNTSDTISSTSDKPQSKG
jgi:proline dehydrogenase